MPGEDGKIVIFLFVITVCFVAGSLIASRDVDVCDFKVNCYLKVNTCDLGNSGKKLSKTILIFLCMFYILQCLKKKKKKKKEKEIKSFSNQSTHLRPIPRIIFLENDDEY